MVGYVSVLGEVTEKRGVLFLGLIVRKGRGKAYAMRAHCMPGS